MKKFLFNLLMLFTDIILTIIALPFVCIAPFVYICGCIIKGKNFDPYWFTNNIFLEITGNISEYICKLDPEE